MAETSFVDFYRSAGISPVSQDISDLGRHYRRRDSLYRTLGIPPAFVRGRSVLEFGPGSGHNALFTASLEPARYVLVDGNPKGVADTAGMLRRHHPGFHNWTVVESLFHDFQTEERFDLVLAEGCIPHQADPLSVLHGLARFVKPGGVFVITTVSAVSYLAEIIRRLARTARIHPLAPPDRQLAVLRPMLRPHLETLKGRSRPVDDWILDNVVQPLHRTALLPMPAAVAALHREFDAYGASPDILTDLRWYKDIADEDRGFNVLATNCYLRRTLNLLDYRATFADHDADFGTELESACQSVWDAMRDVEAQAEPDIRGLLPALEGVAALIGPRAPDTAASLEEGLSWLRDGAPDQALPRFAGWWGRGQQYLSLIRRG